MSERAKKDPRNKRTRPPKGEGVYTKPFQVYVDPEQYAVIAEIAKERGITASEWARRAFAGGIVKHNSRRKASK